jgi:glycosyltransferase involved in cell wall biosynthesis
VVIPAFNAARFLGDAIVSARRQQPEPAEIIVVDDGSTDETGAVVAGYGPDVRYIRQANRGPAAARNAGAALAVGEAIAFLDADDWWPDDALQLLSGPLMDQPGLEAVIGSTQVMEEVAGGAPPISAGRAGLITVLGSALFRRPGLERVGPFDETLSYGEEDVDWFLRAREVGLRIATIAPVTLYYRRHGHNLTQDRRTGSLRLLTSLRRSLARRREPGGDARAFPHWSPAGGGSPTGMPPDA